MTVTASCRWISITDVHPRTVELAYPAAADLPPFRPVFQCAVT
ncbi:MAG: hypothetical protein JO283_07010 [Bradyrhizobium sp.]|nr:hypothetical protein [Bradyrhizobium sp.]